MEELCRRCKNEGCKRETEEFRNSKLPVCIDMENNPEHWDELEVRYFQEEL